MIELSVTVIDWIWNSFGDAITVKASFEGFEVSKVIPFSQMKDIVQIRQDIVDELGQQANIKFVER